MDRLGVRRTLSSWPVRNGSPSPWLQRYKIKKRAATSYALQKPTEDGAENGTKRTPKYVNLSNAVILDAFWKIILFFCEVSFLKVNTSLTYLPYYEKPGGNR